MSIEISNITKSYGKQKALDDISFMVKKGNLVGFLGPNGAGKSTLMKIITGYLVPDSGEVFINHNKITPDNLKLKSIIGYLPENNPLYNDLFVKEFLEISAGFYKLKNKIKRVFEMIEFVGLAEEQHKKIGALSKGYRQRVGLAQALIHDPDVLILDEPTTGLDPNQLEEIRNLIKNISIHKTVILSSHIMQEVEALCNRVIIINKGRIVADGGIAEIKTGSISQKQVVIAEFSKEINPEQLLEINGISSVEKKENRWEIESTMDNDIRPVIFKFAVEKNLTLLTLQEKQQNLENIFQQITQN